MKTIVLTGSRDCGKSCAVYNLAQWMLQNGWHDNSEGIEGIRVVTNMSFEEARQKEDGFEDIRQVFLKDGQTCLLWAPMDDFDCLTALKGCIAKVLASGRTIDYLITTLRRYDDPQQYHLTLQEMGWTESGISLQDSDGQEIIQMPLLRVKYEWDKEGVVDWYGQRVAKLLQTIVKNLFANHQ